MTKLARIEQAFADLLQQIAHGLFHVANSVTINYVTGDVTVSIAGVSAAVLQDAKARVAYVSLTVTVDNVAHTATIHAPALAAAIGNLTPLNIQNILHYLTDPQDGLGYSLAIDNAAKTVTLGWDNGT